MILLVISIFYHARARPAGRGRGLRPPRGRQDRVAGALIALVVLALAVACIVAVLKVAHRKLTHGQGLSDHRSRATTAWSSAPAARACAPRSAWSRPACATACISKVYPTRSPHRRGAGRHQRRARQHGAGRLALPHVRHGQGLGLAGRPGRDRVHDQERARRGDRARALRRAVLAHARGQDLSARVRRPVDRLRQERRPTAPAPPPIAPATPCCTRCTSRRSRTRCSSSTSTSRST